MTERRKLKQHVRARMARTGESYTTAHRHVAGNAVRHRESALVRRMLAAAGVELSEPMVCGLGGGIGFLYAVFSYTQVPHPLLTIVAQHHPVPWAPAVLGHLRISYREEHSSSAATAMAKLRTALETGPVLCTVDRSGLPGHGDAPMFSGADPYPVLVLSMAQDQVRLLDDGRRPVTVPTDAFTRAWAGHRKGRHHHLRVVSVPQPLDLRAAVADAVATTVAHLTGPVLGNAFDVNFGLSGMAKLAADLRAPRGRTAWRTRFGDHVSYAMQRLVDGLQRELTAADATRPLYADFLTEATGLLGGTHLPEAIAAIRASGAGWAEVTRLASQPPPDAGALFDQLADLVDGCVAHERSTAALLSTSS